MKSILSLLLLIALPVAAETENSAGTLPLDQMTCAGPFVPNFFDGLTLRSDLNDFVSALGRHPDTFYKFELVGNAYVAQPTFNGGHDLEYVFLSLDKGELSVSRFFMLKGQFVLVAQHPVEILTVQRKLQYRHSKPGFAPDWICQY